MSSSSADPDSNPRPSNGKTQLTYSKQMNTKHLQILIGSVACKFGKFVHTPNLLPLRRLGQENDLPQPKESNPNDRVLTTLTLPLLDAHLLTKLTKVLHKCQYSVTFMYIYGINSVVTSTFMA